MDSIRAFLVRHRAFAAVLVALALFVKAIVPSGYMIGSGERILTIQICDPSLGHGASQKIAIPMKPGGDGADKAAKIQGDCAFSSLSMVSLAGADPLLLAIAFAFILTLGFAPAPVPAGPRTPFLRPHLRGPPALA